jgi:hypothetical protein
MKPRRTHLPIHKNPEHQKKISKEKSVTKEEDAKNEKT